MKKSTVLYILSLLMFIGCTTWMCASYGWQLAAILFILKWSYNIEDKCNDIEEDERASRAVKSINNMTDACGNFKNSKFQQRIEEQLKKNKNSGN